MGNAASHGPMAQARRTTTQAAVSGPRHVRLRKTHAATCSSAPAGNKLCASGRALWLSAHLAMSYDCTG